MIGPLNALMGAVVPLLKADPALSEMIGQRVYDTIPEKAPFPYLSLGSAWETQDDADCLAAVTVGFRIDVWSRAVGFPEARAIAHLVRAVLHEAEIDIPDGALAMLEHRRTDTMRDPDGMTAHAAIEFQAVIET